MKKKILVLVIPVTLLFFGCLPANNMQEPTLTSPAPTFTLTKKPTQIIVTETSTPAPTPTNFPSMSNETRKDVLMSLVQNNGGCQLPCILGITPGISDSSAMNAFMNYFQANSYTSNDQINNVNVDTFRYDDWSGTNLYFFENRVNVWISVEAKIIDKQVRRLVLFGQGMQMIDGGAKKLYGDPYYDKLMAKFSLSNILEEYGQPDQILIRPFPNDEGHPSPPAQYTFDFVLFYPKQGFVAEYVSIRAEEENSFVGCPTKSYFTHISSWNPEKSISITEAIEYFSNLDGISEDNISEYKQIQDVTSLGLTDFYNMFRTPNSNGCVKTSKELWAGATQ
jgi:hypothetical protein